VSPATGGEPDPDALLEEVRRAAGPPPLPPLTLAAPAPSDRRGPVGPAVGAARRALMRLIGPALGDLLAQLERDRHRVEARLDRIEERIARLEGGSGPERE
jgi:hypothetical protein